MRYQVRKFDGRISYDKVVHLKYPGYEHGLYHDDFMDVSHLTDKLRRLCIPNLQEKPRDIRAVYSEAIHAFSMVLYQLVRCGGEDAYVTFS